MDAFTEVTNIIEQAQKKGVNFGKSSPYNRLRYYTKLGLLPHMERRKNAQGSIVGHYPSWTLERLVLIEKLKNEGLENSQIAKKIQEINAKQNTLSALKNPSLRSKILAYFIVFTALLIIASELRVIPIGLDKYKLMPGALFLDNQSKNADAGSYFVPGNSNTVFVKYEKVQPLSKIVITFTQDYSPASKYWIQKVEPGKGFSIELDTKVFNDTWFNWYATQ